MALLLGFATRLIIARYGSEADYGVYSMAYVIMTFATVLVSLGLPDGVARYIAYFRGKRETAKVRGITAVSLQLSVVISLIFGLALFFSAGYIASNIFHIPELGMAIPTDSQAASMASAALSKMRLSKAAGVILIPPNCGQELWDLIEISDRISAQNIQKYRIIGIHLVYNPISGEFYQRLRLA